MKKGLLLAFTLLAASFTGSAATISFTNNVNLTSTNWATNLSLQQFDSSLGTLNSVRIDINGTVFGTIKLENQNDEETDLSGNLVARLRVGKIGTAPGSVTEANMWFAISPTYTQEFTAAAFDETTDFGGTSGVTYANVTASTAGFYVTSVSERAQFVGNGTILIPVRALGQSFASGGGNITSQFITQAAATVSVTYDYSPAAVPEPSSMALAGTALIGAAFMLRRRK